MNRYLPLWAAAIAAGTIFAATGAEAGTTISGVCSDASTSLPSCTCKSPSGFTITASTPTPGFYHYALAGSGNAKVNAIRDLQIVVPRPVAPSNTAAGTGIVYGTGGSDATSFLNYCQADPNSGNNKGNCDGFLVHALPHSTTNTTGLLDIGVGQSVGDGVVTFNIIGGNGNTELCSALDQSGAVRVPPSGIVGPGDIGDPFQPKFAEQQATVSGGACTAHLVFDKKGNVIDVTTDPPCFAGAPGINPATGLPFCITDPAHPELGCQVTNFPTADGITINGKPLTNNTGPHGLTFDTHTTTCYGPSIPSPAKCVCTKLPCP
jgi:hypothetical protein